jgi:hypothetical protein
MLADGKLAEIRKVMDSQKWYVDEMCSRDFADNRTRNTEKCEKSNSERNMKLVCSKSNFTQQRFQIETGSVDQKRNRTFRWKPNHKTKVQLFPGAKKDLDIPTSSNTVTRQDGEIPVACV